MRAGGQTYWVLLAILLVGMAVRIYCVIGIDLLPEFDFKRYYEVALSFADGRGLTLAGIPFIVQPPFYSEVLGVWFHLFGGSAWSGKFLNLVISCGTLVVWAWVVIRAGFPSWAQIVSLFIFAIHPAIVSYVVVLGTETLSVFLSVLLLASSLLKRGRWPLTGTVCGFMVLNRPQMLIVPIMIGFVTFLVPALQGKFNRGPLILLGVATLVVGSWTARNWVVFNAFVPVSANGGYVLMVNNNSNNVGGAWMPLSEVPLDDADIAKFKKAAGLDRVFFQGKDEGAKLRQWSPQADKVAQGVGSQWIMTHPEAFLKLAWLRVRLTFDGGSLMMWPFRQTSGGAPRILALGAEAIDLGLTIVSGLACVVGLFSCGGSTLRLPWLCGVAVMMSTFAGVLIFEGQGRYILPMVPTQLFVALSVPLSRTTWLSCRRGTFSGL